MTVTPMRVAMVSEHANPLAALGGVDAGGQNVHVGALACELGRRGLEVSVHTRRDSAELPPRVSLGEGAVVEHVPAGPAHPVPKDELLPFIAPLAEGLAERWSEDRPDVVHAHFWMSGMAALAAARPLGIPVIQTFHALGHVKRRHQGPADTSPPERLAEERRVARSVDLIVATCHDEVRELQSLGVHRDRTTVVPCGVDLDVFRPDGPVAPRRAGLGRLVVVGRLVERKGVADAVTALRHLPDVELVVAGGPPGEDLDSDPEVRRLRAVADRAGVSERLTMCGQLERSAVAALLRSADLTVTVPWYEPFGIVPLESMACGTPVVAAAVGGLTDSVVDGVTGALVEPRDPEGLARVAGDLLGSPSRLRRMAREGVRRARGRYSWSRVAGSTERAYRRALSGQGGGQRRPGALAPVHLPESGDPGRFRVPA